LFFLFALSGLLLLFFGADDLFYREGIGASFGHINDRDGEERQTRNGGI